MNILVYHGKHGDQYWLIDSRRRRNGAFQALFNQLDQCGYYADEDPEQLALARSGNTQAIAGILHSRQCCEYETWEIEYADIKEQI
jgi:hypothetical protein